MLKHYALIAAAAIFSISGSHAQLGFTNSTELMSNTTYSGGCMGVVDMNGDGRDDIAKLHLSREFQVDHQNPDGTFTLVDYGEISEDDQWGMSIGDIDNDGHKDLVCGGSYDGVHYLRISDIGNSVLEDLNNGSMFMQCNNIADINNDGHNDFFACHDDAAPKIWINDGDGDLLFDDTVMDFTTSPNSDMSGNYGSVWTDFDNDGDLDLYIAKCRQGVNDPNDPRRWNRLFVNDGSGNFSDLAASRGVQVKYQSWSADFGDIDNDGDFDLVITNHDHTLQLFENDGAGNFSEITAGSGLEITGFFLQSKFIDLDNDGYVDLLFAGGIERVFHNNGDNTFTQVNGLFPAAKAMHSFATGDLNNDGFMDVFANYGSGYVDADLAHPDRLWMNNGNDNHWFSVRLQGTTSNLDAIGARVTITGPWGTQIREVRAGESYGIVTTFACNFGLGQHSTVPTITVRWPSGLVETYTDIAADQTITIIEGGCISPAATITFPGAHVLCSANGTPVILEAPAGFIYEWSTGAQTQQINVTEPGNYTLTIDDGTGCTGTSSVFIPEDPDQTPTIQVAGDTRICEGGSIVLSTNTTLDPVWNTTETTNTIEVNSAGIYTVSVQGTCANFTSAPVEIQVFATPDEPVVSDQDVYVGEAATFNATGEGILWYDQPIDGSPIATGNEFITPPLMATTSYWVSSSIEHGDESQYGAREDKTTNGGYHNNATYYLIFDAYEAMTIRSVKVYANGAGNRPIAVVDMGSGETITSGTFAIPDGESRVDLEFDVPAGGPYGLRVVNGDPQLWRDQAGSGQTYPYPLGDLGQITSTSVAGGNATELYYFFYDWEVAPMTLVCESPRVEAVALVGGIGLNEVTASGEIQLWPNPASELITIGMNGISGPVSIELMDMLGRRIFDRSEIQRDAEGSFNIHVGDLASGDYLVRIMYDGGSVVRHVIIQ